MTKYDLHNSCLEYVSLVIYTPGLIKPKPKYFSLGHKKGEPSGSPLQNIEYKSR
ncbi:hypothetical protein VCHA38O210_10303 [Vibrio chagasii]|nr:hypothetical protein VCHA43P282_20439 [Vibrio chagasii]CAH7283467.1 hypothetical protein VCHA38O210_10303 [Vibrio chagasii]